MAVNLSGFGSMVIDIDGLRADVQFLDSFGRIQDYFTIRKDVPTDEPLPRLGAIRSGQQLILTWPTSLRPFQLQSAAADSSPWTWSPLSPPTNIVGRQFRATLPIDHPDRLFRLRKAPP
jgi:hypothetical protein